MKLIYVTLIAVGAGITGFVAGGGVGLWGGATAGGLAGGGYWRSNWGLYDGRCSNDPRHYHP
jgi:hypothetical protein